MVIIMAIVVILVIILMALTAKGVCHHRLTQFVGGAMKIGSGLALNQHLVTLESDNI